MFFTHFSASRSISGHWSVVFLSFIGFDLRKKGEKKENDAEIFSVGSEKKLFEVKRKFFIWYDSSGLFEIEKNQWSSFVASLLTMGKKNKVRSGLSSNVKIHQR